MNIICYPNNLQESITVLCPLMCKPGRLLKNMSSLSAASSCYKSEKLSYILSYYLINYRKTGHACGMSKRGAI